MTNKTTNVCASDLNYDKYANKTYDDNIKRSIPWHDELHNVIEKIIYEFSSNHKVKKILDLGIGTWLTSEKILKSVPNASLFAIDFSEQMMNWAKKRLSKYKVSYIVGDYSELDFGTNFDIVVSVISIHHQNNRGKKRLFKKIFNCLCPKGIFIFGDLVTYHDRKKAASNDAKHYHYLVENIHDEQSLQERTYHHKFLNLLTPIEEQIKWLEEAWFSKVEVKYEYFNTALIIATK